MSQPRLLLTLGCSLFALTCANYRLDSGQDGGGGGAGGGTGGGGGGGALGDGGFGPVCKDVGRQAGLSPLDLLVVLDVSYSMDYDQKWISVNSALKSFVTRPENTGLGMGLQYFPLRAQCSVADYQTPAVPFGILPGVGTAIGASLDVQQMSGGTPTVPVLEGTTAYAEQWAAQNPNRKVVVVLATDGVPDDSCVAQVDAGLPNSLANVLVVARAAATASPPVKTFVIGVGSQLTSLNQIADAGGTQSAILVDTTANADVAFLNALTQIRRSALGCNFDVPVSIDVDPTQARVRFVPDDGSAETTVPQVSDVSQCGQGEGWFFDDPSRPTKLSLCNATCDTLTGGKVGHLFVEFECSVT